MSKWILRSSGSNIGPAELLKIGPESWSGHCWKGHHGLISRFEKYKKRLSKASWGVVIIYHEAANLQGPTNKLFFVFAQGCLRILNMFPPDLLIFVAFATIFSAILPAIFAFSWRSWWVWTTCWCITHWISTFWWVPMSQGYYWLMLTS